jgi:hypothetical protein
MKSSKAESGFYEAYVDFARNLRIWLLAYGIGGPAAFLTNEGAARILRSSLFGRQITYCFMAGVALQVFVALLYKRRCGISIVGNSMKVVRFVLV